MRAHRGGIPCSTEGGIRESVRFGLVWGIALAFPFSSLLALALVVGSAADILYPATPTSASALPVARLVVAYFIGAALSGSAFATLQCRVTSARGALVAGIAAAVPFFVSIRVAFLGLSVPTWEDALRLGIGAVVMGGTLGVLLMSERESMSSTSAVDPQG